MISDEDRGFVQQCLDDYFVSFSMMLPIKHSPSNPDDHGVPPEMTSGPVEAGGWVPWKMLPSTVSEAEVAHVEKGLPGPFPPLFRAYLTTRFILGMDWFDLPNLPSDNPLGELRACLTRWALLGPAGYVAFKDNAVGETGPLAFDLRRRVEDGDCPIVLFEQEQLQALGEEFRGQRGTVEPLARPAFGSFREMLLQTLGARPPEEPQIEEGDDESENQVNPSGPDE